MTPRRSDRPDASEGGSAFASEQLLATY